MSKWNKYRLKDFAIDKNGKPYLYASFNTYGLRGVQPQKKAVFFPSKILDEEYVIVPKDKVDELERDVDWKVKFPTALESIQTKEIDIVPKSVVEEIEGMPLETDKFSLLSQAIQVENDSVIFYQNLMEIFPEWREVLQDITNEELKHIGQLEALRNEQPQVGQKVEEGENEADAQMKGIAVEGVDQMKGQMNYQGVGAKESYYVDNKIMSAFEDFEDEHIGKSAVDVDDLGWPEEDSTKFKSMLKDLGKILTDNEEETSEVFYHFDNRDFIRGDTIESPHYKFSQETKDAYNKVVPGGDASDIIYLYRSGDTDLDEHLEVFKNCYKIKPLGPVEKRYMDYSPVIYELNKDIIFGETPDPNLFARAYSGDEEARNEIKEKYNYFSDKVEYICQSGEVLEKVEETDEDDLEDAGESITRDERESKDPEAKEACACESSNSDIMTTLTLQIDEASDEDDLNAAENAIETAHADGDITEDDFNYLYGLINSKR